MDPYVRNTQEWINQTYAGKPATPDIGPVTEDGLTGWQTVNALVRALQYELGITNRSDTFGPATLSALTAVSPVNNSTLNKNIVKIAQGGMYCKGYPGGNGYITGVWDATAIGGMQSFRNDIGLSTGNGDIEPKVFKALLNMDAFKLVGGGTSTVRLIQRSLNARYTHRKDYYIIPTEGRYTGDVQTALVYAIQYELGIADGVANGNVGPTTKSRLGTMANLSMGSTDTVKWLVHLYQAALIFYGYTVPYDGTFGATTKSATDDFQYFVKLPVTGTANMQTWCSLLVSYGDADRPGKGADCVTTIEDGNLYMLQSAGYTHFGRYLTNTPDFSPAKCIENGELERIIGAGGHVFPLFQTGGGKIEHFYFMRGHEVAEEAAAAAWAYRIPDDTIIYFSVDFDATAAQVTNSIVPYFQGVNDRINCMGRNYRVGAYAPRRVCHELNAAGLVVSTFVSDMSAGFGSNKAQVLPGNWAFDQIQTKWEGAHPDQIEIDKSIVSGRDNGFNVLARAWGIGDDPLVPANHAYAMYESIYLETYNHEEWAVQQTVMANRDSIRARFIGYDDYITGLAAEFNCHKAMIIVPMVHEGLCWDVSDAGGDELVKLKYDAWNAAGRPASGWGAPPDSSTGFCQIFAKTGIAAHNYAVGANLITGSQMSHTNWEDMNAMWTSLYSDGEFNLKMAMLVMMMEASKYGVTPADWRTMTPSQVIGMCFGYNGVNEAAMIYGRKRMVQYYFVQAWEESFKSGV